MSSWTQIKRELLKDPTVKKHYNALEPAYKVASALIGARIEQKLTQAAVAKRAGVSQVVVARLESGTGNPTVATVSRVAKALGVELRLADAEQA